jgi:hypothetical protein
VDKSKIYLPPLHIKLALIKIFVKVMDKESKGFAYLRKKLPKITETKMKKEFSLVLKLNNYSKTTTLVQNCMLQREEPGRHFKRSAGTF